MSKHPKKWQLKGEGCLSYSITSQHVTKLSKPTGTNILYEALENHNAPSALTADFQYQRQQSTLGSKSVSGWLKATDLQCSSANLHIQTGDGLRVFCGLCSDEVKNKILKPKLGPSWTRSRPWLQDQAHAMNLEAKGNKTTHWDQGQSHKICPWGQGMAFRTISLALCTCAGWSRKPYKTVVYIQPEINHLSKDNIINIISWNYSTF
jgi:hypothetical protein